MTPRRPVEEDLEFERAQWRFTRVLWYALLALMAATLLGVFGNGPVSSAEVGSREAALRIQYERFGRLGAAMRTTVHLQPAADGSASFTIDRPYLDAIRIVAITPEPESAALSPDGIRYRFTGLAAPAVVTLDFEPVQPWRVRGRFTRDATEHSVSHFIYP